MKKIFLILMVSISLFADMKIIIKEKTVHRNSFTVLTTACVDGNTKVLITESFNAIGVAVQITSSNTQVIYKNNLGGCD